MRASHATAVTAPGWRAAPEARGESGPNGRGELVCLLGGNASGKSTTLKTILGIVRPRSGRVLLNGEDVTQWPVPRRIAAGLAIVPENRRLFGQLTVRENLELGASRRWVFRPRWSCRTSRSSRPSTPPAWRS